MYNLQPPSSPRPLYRQINLIYMENIENLNMDICSIRPMFRVFYTPKLYKVYIYVSYVGEKVYNWNIKNEIVKLIV